MLKLGPTMKEALLNFQSILKKTVVVVVVHHTRNI